MVVTGLGVISAFGQGVEPFWQALSQGVCGIRALQGVRLDSLRFTTGAQIPEYQPTASLASLDPFAQYFVVSAREALADSGLQLSPELRPRTAIVSATSSPGQVTQDDQYHRLYQEGKDRLHPLTVPRVMANAGASQLATELGVVGPVFTLSTACSSANHAIGLAFWMVRQGMAEVALAGGSDAPFCYGNLKAWEAMRVVDPNRCRPFSRNRLGMSLGEAGATLLLETHDSALQRGARIYAEIVGFGMTADAYQLTRPHPEGAASAMSAALQDARLRPDQVDYINAHGTGTLLNDACETTAIRAVFGGHADRLLVSSTKSMHGHTLGAAGAIEGVATLLALHHGLVPPTVSFEEPDPECDLDVVANTPRETPIKVALSNSFALGGLNAVLAFSRG